MTDREHAFGIRVEVEEGLSPYERIARVPTSDGPREEVAVPTSLLHDHTLLASLISRAENRALMELPRESMSGRWRLWVPLSALVEFA